MLNISQYFFYFIAMALKTTTDFIVKWYNPTLLVVNIFYEISTLLDRTIQKKSRLLKTFADISDRNFCYRLLLI